MSGLSRTFFIFVMLVSLPVQQGLSYQRHPSGLFHQPDLGEFLNQIVDGCDFVDLPRISTGKYQTMIDISADGTDQCHGDAVGGSSRIAGLQAVEAVGDRNSVLAESFDKRIQQSASRHMDRTLNDGNIAFLALTYIFLNASEASHSLVATKRVAICTPERPSER